MGTRVLLSGLDSLYRNQEWNNKNFKIASAHVMGAAVDNEEIAKVLRISLTIHLHY
jgi:hypothetical protein